MEPVAAATFPPTRRDSLDGLRLVPDAYLTELDPRFEFAREVADVRTKIDALFGSEVEKEFLSVKEILDIHELHRQIVPLQNLPCIDKDMLLFVKRQRTDIQILGRRAAFEDDILQRWFSTLGLSFVRLFKTGRTIPFFLLSGEFSSHESDFHASGRLYKNPLPPLYGEIENLHNAEISRLTEEHQIFAHRESPPVVPE